MGTCSCWGEKLGFYCIEFSTFCDISSVEDLLWSVCLFVVCAQWIAPSQTDKLFKDNIIKFAPPQFAEVKKFQRLAKTLTPCYRSMSPIFCIYNKNNRTNIFLC